MATKKNAPVKAGKSSVMPVKKAGKTVKPLAKSSGKSPAPAKKAAPKKVQPKPAAGKAVAKSAPKKVVAAPVAKKTVKPIQKTVKPGIKVASKKAPVPSKATKTVARQANKAPEPVKKVPVNAVKSASKIMAKKEEMKKPAVNTAQEKQPAAKPVAEVKVKEPKVAAPKPVVIPKISTKTVRKYQPEFTKSVLDKTQRDLGAPSQRYSDTELQEFKELIQRKLEAAKKELSYLHGLITRKDEMGGDEGDNRYMTMEDGSLSMEREQLSQMASRQITFIDHLEKAVMRIENKTYGICRVTGKLIDKARLRAVPHATLSIEAKMGAAK